MGEKLSEFFEPFKTSPILGVVFFSPTVALVATSVARDFFCRDEYLLDPELGLHQSLYCFLISCAAIFLREEWCRLLVGHESRASTAFLLLLNSTTVNGLLLAPLLVALKLISLGLGISC